jgi:hypothetical protein
VKSLSRLAILAILTVTYAATAQSPALAVKATIQLAPATDGFDGKLELLEDSRLTPELDKTLWGAGGPEMALDENDPLYKQLASAPLQHATLRLKDRHGKGIKEMTLDREQARISVQTLHPVHRTILVTIDLSAGFGSYSGPLTELLDVSHGKLEFAMAQDAHSRTEKPLYLANTLKTAWRFSPASNDVATQKDILEVACRPNADAIVFYTTYTRYHWNGSEWISVSRRSAGMWESDQPFPAASRFPKADGVASLP